MKKLLLLPLLLYAQLSFAQTDKSIKTLTGHTGAIEGVAFSPDSKTAVSGATDKTIKLWDLSTGQCLRNFGGNTSTVWGVAYSPDGKKIISGTWDKNLKLWDVATGQCLKTLKGHTHLVTSVAYSPDGKMVLSGSGDSTLKMWDISTGECLKTFRGHKDGISSVAFSPDNKTILSGSWDNKLKQWDIATGQCLKTFTGHSNDVNTVAFSPDGKTALSGGTDSALKLWDIASGKCLKTFTGHSWEVRSVVYSPDGKTVVSGSSDNTVRLWDISTGKCLKTFTGHTDIIYAVAYSPDGRTVLSGSSDKTIKQWDVSKYNTSVTVSKPVNTTTQTTTINNPTNNTPVLSTEKPVENKSINSDIKTNTNTANVSASVDVDINIPFTTFTNDKTFVVIIANENYSEEVKVDFAINDGTVFKEYCEKTLGIPADNIHLIKNATYGKLITEKDWLANNIKAYKGEAKAIFYYAGHGIPGGKDEPAYLLPADGTSSNVLSALKLDDLYATLTENPSKGVTIFLDACFSGSTRDSGMLYSTRGTKLRPREITLPTNLVVFSAASGDETAWPYRDKQHGMFTYFLLKKLQETKGDIGYKDLADYINDNVYKTAIKLNNKPQTPTTKAGADALDWGNWKLK